ncbi:MAG TPA: amidohydrolase/deacetylase family metallohydrolase [Bryobacteraceae bacterium]|nr:amidohydrolase/deacetylase family metallohydrolase [Bryobacteraceae bacterium]
MRILFALLAASSLTAQGQYDLLLKGGHVIDAKNGINGVRDVAIAGGKIAAVAVNIPADRARSVVDAASLYVTPGLVDIHVHVFAGSMQSEYTGANSIRPDGFTFRSGVTTAVDAGSSGWRNFEQFKTDIIDRSRTRVLAMLNIVGHGMGGRADVEQNTADMDAKNTAEVAKRYSDIVVGIKIAHYKGPEWLAVERAVEAGKMADVPVMVDFADFREERPFQDLVGSKLRPGDIYTHTYLRAVPMLDGKGKVLPYLFQAQKRGVIFDVGHGAGSFSWKQAAPAVRQGFYPNSISTDLHVDSMNAGMKDMLNVASKFLALGMPLHEVIARCTWNPAREIRREQYGHLSPGAVADIAVLRLEKGSFGFVDSARLRMPGKEKLVAEMTIKDGRIVWDLNGLSSPLWDATPPPQQTRLK